VARKILLCFIMTLAMVLIITPSSYARDGTFPLGVRVIGDGVMLEGEQIWVGISTDDFGVDYIRYGIYNPGWQLSKLKIMKNTYNNANGGGCHTKMNLPEPRQRSPSNEDKVV